MNVVTERIGGATVVALTGRLDSSTSKDLDDHLSGIIDAAPVVVIDMGSLNYVSSAGLRILLKAAKQAKSRASKLMLCALHPHVREVFDISGFSSIFAIHADRSAALGRQG